MSTFMLNPQQESRILSYWLCTITIDENFEIKGQENAYKIVGKGAVGGADLHYIVDCI